MPQYCLKSFKFVFFVDRDAILLFLNDVEIRKITTYNSCDFTCFTCY